MAKLTAVKKITVVPTRRILSMFCGIRYCMIGGPPACEMKLVKPATPLQQLPGRKVGADGTAIMAHLARLLDIKPFVLRQRDELDAAGVLEFIETLELATPKH